MDGNEASARVSGELGYLANGERLLAPKGPACHGDTRCA